jgi:hypothetical protein
MKDKYIEEEYPVYFVWGKRVDGRVDIATTSDDTVATVSQEHAEKLIQDRNDLVRRLCDMAQAFDRSSPEEFKKFWYGSCLAQPEPAELTDQEVADAFAQGCRDGAINSGQPAFLRGARAAIAADRARYGTPAIQPVPVSERAPRTEDCDAEGRCWWWHPDHKEDDFDDGWILLNPKWADGRRDSDDSLIYSHWLPANAQPTPQTTNA